jgi:hypothetical protein
VPSIAAPKAIRPITGWQPAPVAPGPAPADPVLPADRVSLSPEARERLRAGRGAPGGGLGAAQEREVAELRRRDQHVRAHEAAHQAAGGDLTGPASFTYRVGPDGRSYAVGGEVQVSPRLGRTPDETIAIARRVRAAALAPADPSPADLAAAATASALELRAMEQKRRAQAGAPAVTT